MSGARGVEPPSSIFEDISCYACGSPSTEADELVRAQDDLTGKPGTFRFVRCRRCGLAYQSPRVDLAHIKDYYDDEYIAHRKTTSFGPFTRFYERAMSKHDRDKVAIVRRYVELDAASQVLDVGCAVGTFLLMIKDLFGSAVTGVDFKDMSHYPRFEEIAFHHGLFYEQDLGEGRFDLITMWHFLEHDYDPRRSLRAARSALAEDGRLIIEVPRLDSVTYRLYGDRWPGLQAPQHTVLFDKAMLLNFVRREGFEVVDYLPYGAFPAYFYLFAGAAFKVLKGRGLNLKKAIGPYFAGQLALLPVLLMEKRLNLAMQTVVCRRA